jgi:iron complex transport system substrate-binding protein
MSPFPRPHQRPRSHTLVAAVVGSLLLAACGTNSTPTVSSSGSSAGTSAGSSAGTSSSAGPKHTTYPVTVQNCGKPVTFTKAPTRVVTLDPNVAETLITLGLQDRIVGLTQFQTDEAMWAPTKTAMKSLKVINDINVGYPSKEAILALSPDFVTSIYPSALKDNETLPTIEGWQKLGINAYLVGGCVEKVWHDFGPLYEMMRDLGTIFDVQDRAETEIATLQARVTSLQQKLKDAKVPSVSVTMHDGETEHPGTLGLTVPVAIIEQAGGTYALLHDDSGATAVSWETWVKRDGQVIWLITELGQTAPQIIHQLETDPRVASVTAVKNKAFVTISYNDAGESPRAVDGFQKMVDGLIALHLT